MPLLSPNARSETESQWARRTHRRSPIRSSSASGSGLKTSRPPSRRTTPHQLDRVWQLNERSEIRNVIGQSESSFTMREVIAERKVLLVNLSSVGGETARLAGTLLLNAIWSAVRSRAADPARPTTLAFDEFEDYMNLPVDAERMLVHARSFGVAMVLAHQHLDQLPERIRLAVLANVATKIIFRSGHEDARVRPGVRA